MNTKTLVMREPYSERRYAPVPCLSRRRPTFSTLTWRRYAFDMLNFFSQVAGARHGVEPLSDLAHEPEDGEAS